MAANAFINLFGPEGRPIVRSGRTTTDIPTTGLWTPDNRNPAGNPPDETGDDPDSFILDARGWDTIRVVGSFVGTPGGIESVEIEPLISLPQITPPGRDWVMLPKVTLSPSFDTGVISVNGHFASFRITGLTLNGATSVTVFATGGIRRRDES